MKLIQPENGLHRQDTRIIFYDLFNDAVGNSGYIASNWRMFRE